MCSVRLFWQQTLGVLGALAALSSFNAEAQLTTKKDGLEPLEKGHVDLTYVYMDGKWKIFLQVDEDKLLPLNQAVNGVPSLAPGDNVLVATDHPFPNGSRIERAEGPEWDFLGVGQDEPLWFIPQSNWNCVWPGMVVRGPFARHLEDDPRINAIDDWVTFHLRDVRFTGTSDEGEYTTSKDGHFSTWNTSASRGVTAWVASADGIDEGDAFFLSGTLSHAHFTWGFSRRGIYEIDLQATAIHERTGEPIVSDLATYHWAVGGYAQWLAANFSTRTLTNVSMSGPEADPDGDSQVNLYEYAFGSHPRIVERLPGSDRSDEITSPQLLPDEEGRVHFCYGRRQEATSPQIQYHHEASRDLRDWEAMSEEGIRTEESGMTGWEIVHLPLPEDPSQRNYYRVRVTLDQ